MLDVHDCDDEVTAAAVLHDTLEDTELSAEELEQRFGARVARLVRSLTEDARLEGEPERKAALREQVFRLDGDVGSVFAADKLSKVRELRIRLSCRPASADETEVRSKLDHYRESLRVLEASMPGDSLVRHLRFELEALHALPPHGQHLLEYAPPPPESP
jgi:(p)ppGpp synthase/HD superfamily hydrolase